MKIITLLFFYFFFIITICSSQQPVLTANIGHSLPVTMVKFSPDNRYLASTGRDKKVIIWDICTGRQLKSFTGFAHEYLGIEFSPDGKYLLVSDMNNKKLFDIASGEIVQIFEDYLSFSKYSCFTTDGKKIISEARDGRIFLWDVKTARKEREFKGHGKTAINNIKLSGDNKYMLTAANDKTILWDFGTTAVIDTMEWGYEGNFSDNSKYLLLPYDKQIKIYEITRKKFVKIITTDSVNFHLFLNSKTNQIVAIQKFGQIDIFDFPNGQLVRNIPANIDAYGSFYFNNDYSLFAYTLGIVNSKNTGIYIRELFAGKELLHLESKICSQISLDLSPNKPILASGSGLSNSFNIWELDKIKPYHNYAGDGTFIDFVMFSADGLSLLSGFTNYEQDRLGKPSMQKFDLKKMKPNDSWHISEVFDNAVYNRTTKSFFGHNINGICQYNESGKKKALILPKGGKFDVSADGQWLVAGIDGPENYAFQLMNIAAKKQIRTFQGHIYGNTGHLPMIIKFSPDKKYILSGGYADLKLWDIETANELKTYECPGLSVANFSNDGKIIAAASETGEIRLFQTNTGNELAVLSGHAGNVNSIVFSPDNKYLYSASNDGSIKIWLLSENKLLITLFSFSNSSDWLVVTPDGHFDGSDTGIKQLHYVKGLDIIPLESFFEQFYTPNLLARIIAGERFGQTSIKIADTKLPPAIKVISPECKNTICNVDNPTLTITVQYTDQGGGIDEIRLFHNAKLIDATQRGFKPLAMSGEKNTISFTVNLIPGENIFRATAFNTDRTEAIPDEIVVNYKGSQPTSCLYLFAVAINTYQNSRYNLNYTLSDAKAFVETVKTGASGIFTDIKPFFISDDKATKENIVKIFDEIRQKAGQQDVFIFYYAGHGVMSEGSINQKSDFFLVPYNVTSLYGNDDMLIQKAISSNELMELSREIKSQKQLFVLDACQSGGAIETFASRGAAEEKAIIQLARSAGLALFAASGSEQFATEFKELNHGVFTYAILEALKGNADGGNKDRKITVSEIRAFLDDKVPELTQQYRGQSQFPQCIVKGMDFPVVIVKQ